MDSKSSNRDQDRNLDDVREHEPQSKHGTQGEAVHGGDQAGPNSADAGEPLAPQTGEPIEHSH